MDRRAALLVGAFGFACFMPYPAINYGNTSAIQIGNLLSLALAVPALALSWRRRPFHLYPLILLPLILSVLAASIGGGGDPVLGVKSSLVWVVSGVTLLALQLHAPRHASSLLTGVAMATVVHVAVGLWQYYCFVSGAAFPFAWLYVNHSFLSVQANANTIARYIQRPFGLFPEPSAMSSSLAPFVLFWAAHLCGLLRMRREPPAWQQRLWWAAAAGATLLILLSRSGHAAVTLAAGGVIGLMWFARCRATPRTFIALAAVFAVILPVLVWLGTVALSDRLGGASKVGNSSWEERSSSLLIGFSLLTDGTVQTMIFGVGPGGTSPALWEKARLEAVWSVLLTYVYETGLLGIATVGAIGWKLLQTWKSLRLDPVFAAVAAVWLVGITLTTSYGQLLPIWVALGWLTIWPAVAVPVASPRAASPVRHRLMRANDVVVRPVRWSDVARPV